jgi:hypothetical protein
VHPDAVSEQGSEVQQPTNFDLDVGEAQTYHWPPRGHEGENGSVDMKW